MARYGMVWHEDKPYQLKNDIFSALNFILSNLCQAMTKVGICILL